jgi:hypothetical protein
VPGFFVAPAVGPARPASVPFFLEVTMIPVPVRRRPLVPSRLLVLASLCLFLGLLAGCSSAYYNTMEKLGVHKRDIMVDRVGEARDAQKYTALNDQYKQCKAEADNVHKRIGAVESVSAALFREWEAELDQYTSAALRRDSESKLAATRRQYEQLITAMKRAESKIQPVLSVFNDQVLYLKHNLNAQAIAALQGELVSLEENVDRLVREMEASIREADQFISRLQKT